MVLLEDASRRRLLPNAGNSGGQKPVIIELVMQSLVTSASCCVVGPNVIDETVAVPSSLFVDELAAKFMKQRFHFRWCQVVVTHCNPRAGTCSGSGVVHEGSELLLALGATACSRWQVGIVDVPMLGGDGQMLVVI